MRVATGRADGAHYAALLILTDPPHLTALRVPAYLVLAALLTCRGAAQRGAFDRRASWLHRP